MIELYSRVTESGLIKVTKDFPYRKMYGQRKMKLGKIYTVFIRKTPHLRLVPSEKGF